MSLGKIVENTEDFLFCRQQGTTVSAFPLWVWLGGETAVGLQKGWSSAPPWCRDGQHARLKISAPGADGGGQRGVIISLCFSLSTVMDLATSSWAGLGHWWQGRVSIRRDGDCFPPPHLPISLSKRHRMLWYLSRSSWNGLVHFFPPVNDCRMGRNTAGMWPCVRFGGDRGMAGSHVHLHGWTATQVSQDMAFNTV